MANENYDLLTGISEAKLNQIVAKVFNTPSTRSAVFSGRKAGEQMGVGYSIDWTVQAAPTLDLSPPKPTDWARLLGPDGGPVAAQDGAFLISISALQLKVDAAGSALNDTIPVQAIATVSGSGSKLDIEPLGVVVDLSRASAADKVAIKFGLVPEILKMLTTTLTGIQIPQLTFSGVSLTAPAVEARDGHILAAFNMMKDGAPSIGTGAVPNQPFFAIVSRELAQFISNYQVQNGVEGKTFSQKGREAGGGFSAEYSVKGKINSIRVMMGSNPVRMRARAGLSMSASAGVSTPAGMVIDAAGNVVKEVGKVAENVGKAIINPDTWNPTKW